MDPKENGRELAFPFVETREMQGESISFGLTKREHFAAMAMQGMLSDESEGGTGASWNPDDCANRACEYADALLRALAAGGEGRAAPMVSSSSS